MSELIPLIKTLTNDNLLFIDLIDRCITAIENDNNEDIDSLNKEISSEIIKRDSNVILFKEAMSNNGFTSIKDIPKPPEMKEEDFNNTISLFKQSILDGKEKLSEYYKVLSMEFNMLNIIKPLPNKNKVNLKF